MLINQNILTICRSLGARHWHELNRWTRPAVASLHNQRHNYNVNNIGIRRSMSTLYKNNSLRSKSLDASNNCSTNRVRRLNIPKNSLYEEQTKTYDRRNYLGQNVTLLNEVDKRETMNPTAKVSDKINLDLMQITKELRMKIAMPMSKQPNNFNLKQLHRKQFHRDLDSKDQKAAAAATDAGNKTFCSIVELKQRSNIKDRGKICINCNHGRNDNIRYHNDIGKINNTDNMSLNDKSNCNFSANDKFSADKKKSNNNVSPINNIPRKSKIKPFKDEQRNYADNLMNLADTKQKLKPTDDQWKEDQRNLLRGINLHRNQRELRYREQQLKFIESLSDMHKALKVQRSTTKAQLNQSAQTRAEKKQFSKYHLSSTDQPRNCTWEDRHAVVQQKWQFMYKDQPKADTRQAEKQPIVRHDQQIVKADHVSMLRTSEKPKLVAKQLAESQSAKHIAEKPIIRQNWEITNSDEVSTLRTTEKPKPVAKNLVESKSIKQITKLPIVRNDQQIVKTDHVPMLPKTDQPKPVLKNFAESQPVKQVGKQRIVRQDQQFVKADHVSMLRTSEKPKPVAKNLAESQSLKHIADKSIIRADRQITNRDHVSMSQKTKEPKPKVISLVESRSLKQVAKQPIVRHDQQIVKTDRVSMPRTTEKTKPVVINLAGNQCVNQAEQLSNDKTYKQKTMDREDSLSKDVACAMEKQQNPQMSDIEYCKMIKQTVRNKMKEQINNAKKINYDVWKNNIEQNKAIETEINKKTETNNLKKIDTNNDEKNASKPSEICVENERRVVFDKETPFAEPFKTESEATVAKLDVTVKKIIVEPTKIVGQKNAIAAGSDATKMMALMKRDEQQQQTSVVSMPKTTTTLITPKSLASKQKSCAGKSSLTAVSAMMAESENIEPTSCRFEDPKTVMYRRVQRQTFLDRLLQYDGQSDLCQMHEEQINPTATFNDHPGSELALVTMPEKIETQRSQLRCSFHNAREFLANFGKNYLPEMQSKPNFDLDLSTHAEQYRQLNCARTSRQGKCRPNIEKIDEPVHKVAPGKKGDAAAVAAK